MRLAVFSDIHGNLEALQAFQAATSRQSIDRYMCLGDLVGYGANPNECIDLVRSLPHMNCLLGNHDSAAIWDTSPYGMNKHAQKAIFWTMDVLTSENSRFLKTLPTTFTMGDMHFSHANPYNPKAWQYVNSRKIAVRSFNKSSQPLLFVSHTHSPLMITRKNFLTISFTTPVDHSAFPIQKKLRHIFNCGSIGQPRDQKPQACYLIYDTQEQIVTYHRTSYNHGITSQKIIDAGLPAFLAKRLSKGL